MGIGGRCLYATGGRGQKVQQRAGRRIRKLRGVEVGLKQRMGLAALGSAVQQVVEQGIHAGCRHIRVLAQVEGGVEPRVRIGALEGSHRDEMRLRRQRSAVEIAIVGRIEQSGEPQLRMGAQLAHVGPRCQPSLHRALDCGEKTHAGII